MRIELFGDEVEAIRYVDTTGEIIQSMDAVILPEKPLCSQGRLESAISAIRSELRERLDVLNGEGKLLEAQPERRLGAEMWARSATATG